MSPGSTRSISFTTAAELPIGVLFIVRNGHHAEARALPEVVMLHLGNGNVELSNAILDASQHHALFLERPGAWNMELD